MLFGWKDLLSQSFGVLTAIPSSSSKIKNTNFLISIFYYDELHLENLKSIEIA